MFKRLLGGKKEEMHSELTEIERERLGDAQTMIRKGEWVELGQALAKSSEGENKGLQSRAIIHAMTAFAIAYSFADDSQKAQIDKIARTTARDRKVVQNYDDQKRRITETNNIPNAERMKLRDFMVQRLKKDLS